MDHGPICGARLVHGMRRAGGERGVGIPRRHCGADAAISHGGRAHRQRPVITCTAAAPTSWHRILATHEPDEGMALCMMGPDLPRVRARRLVR